MAGIDDFRSTIKGLDGRQFIENIPQICQQMHNDLRILTFGIIVYDQSAPGFRKMLRDDDYWDALERASGDRMVIFSLPDKVERKPPKTVLRHLVLGQPLSDDVGKSYSHLMQMVFNDETLLVYPSVIFFQLEGTEIFDYRLVPLAEGSVYESFKAVKDLFQCISEVLADITPQNYGNRREIFNLIKDKLLTRKYTLYILNGSKHIAPLMGIVKKFFPAT